MPFVVIDIPPDLLPPDLSSSIDELNSTFMSEIWTFFAVAVPIIAVYLLLRSWLRNQ